MTTTTDTDYQQVLDGMESYRPKVVRSGKLSTKQKNFVSYVEQYYHRNRGKLPTPEQSAYALRYTLIEIKYFIQDQTVLEALSRRGISYEHLLSQHASTYLSPTQIATALTISNFADTRPLDLKLESLGVTSSEYYAWLKSAAYRDFVSEMADQALENVKPEAMVAFAQLLRNGNVRALQMYFQMTGALEGENEVVKNLKVTLSRVVEAVARHVQNPEVLQAISEEIGIAAPSASTVAIPPSDFSSSSYSPLPDPYDRKESVASDTKPSSLDKTEHPSNGSKFPESSSAVAGEAGGRAGIDRVESTPIDGTQVEGVRSV